MATRFGRYELVRPLGRGGMAEVFLAVHRGLGGYEKQLVIKRVLPKMAADEKFLRLFFDEAKLHVKLSHGNLVPIFDFGRVGNDYFLAMEYVEGRDLMALLKAGGLVPLAPGAVVLIGQELARALAYVHRHGLVHRDVTPRNVLISVEGEVKLADFGVARPAGEAQGVAGTIAYMAPEQARGDGADARTDVYALGLVLAEAATGKPVRARSDDTEASLRAAASAPRVEIGGPLAEVIARATDPDPAARYQSADALSAALDEVARKIEVSRASAASALAAQVRDLQPLASEGELIASHDGPATYFRDAATQASIVDAILATPDTPKNRAILPLGMFALIAVLASGSYWWATHRAVPPPSSPTTTTGPLPSPTSTPTPSVTPPPSPSPSPSPAPRPRPAPTAKVTKTAPAAPAVPEATLRVKCSPWCVVDVDGKRHGEDGRAHTLKLPAGKHRVIAHRLEDQKERAVELQPGGAVDLDLVFD